MARFTDDDATTAPARTDAPAGAIAIPLTVAGVVAVAKGGEWVRAHYDAELFAWFICAVMVLCAVLAYGFVCWMVHR